MFLIKSFRKGVIFFFFSSFSWPSIVVLVSHKGITLVDHLLCVPERTEATWLTNIIFQLFYVLGFVWIKAASTVVRSQGIIFQVKKKKKIKEKKRATIVSTAERTWSIPYILYSNEIDVSFLHFAAALLLFAKLAIRDKTTVSTKTW